MNFHSRILVYFDTIRRAGSIREAARRLHVASSAVNRQLLQIEEEIGTPLFERMPRGLRLTPAGEIFSRHVITVLQDAQRLEGELDALRGVRRGTLDVVAAEGLASAFLPALVAAMAERHPMVRIRVRTDGSAASAQRVIDGDADVALVFSQPRHEALRQFAVGRFRLGAVVPPSHPLARLRTVGFADCAAHPLILAGPGLSIHEAMLPLVSHARRPLTVALETASIELMKQLAVRGLGVAFQTRLGLEREIRQGELVHLPLRGAGDLVSELGVYARAGRALPPALDAFIRIASEEVARRAAEEA